MIYMLCGKNGELMCSYYYSRWAEPTKDNDSIYVAQGEDATAKSRCRSINRVVKDFVRYIKREIENVGHSAASHFKSSKTFDLIFQEILSNNITATDISSYSSKASGRVDQVIYSAIQNNVKVKIMDLFTGAISYEEVGAFMSKDVQEMLL